MSTYLSIQGTSDNVRVPGYEVATFKEPILEGHTGTSRDIITILSMTGENSIDSST